LTDPNGEPFCTGTLVSTTTVVTAAHCVEAMPLSKTRVVYGYLHPEAAPPAARLAVSKSTAHPKYNPGASLDTDGLGQVNDIGVVVLAEPLTAARYTPILPPERVEEILYPFRDIYLAGYGVYQMPYKMGDLFKAVTPHIRHIEWEMLAGKPGNPDTCNGDSGGPAYVAIGCELWLVGVTSRAWAKSVKPCGDGGIYALASSYLSFIEGVSGGPLPAGEGTGGGLPNVVCEDGGLDAGWDVLPDVDGKCFPATSVCDPLTNFGCDEAAGQVCGLGDYGMPGCKPGPHVAGPGQSCDDSGRSCIAGYYCGKSLRCEKLCCGDGDCGEGAACTRLDTVSGTLGTCPPVSGKDAAAEQADAQEAAAEAASEAGSEGGIEAEAGAAAQGVGATDDGGCSCRSGPGSSKGGWALVLLACAALARRRATCRPPAP
jgi:MYXO-CTERM domain-containing protein